MTHSQWKNEADDLLRGVSGAFLFGAPLLYTMEVWWKGTFTSPLRMGLALVLTYVALIALDRTIGFRKECASTWFRSLTDSAEALAIGLLTATIGLVLVRRIPGDFSLEVVLGHIIMEAVPFSIGVGIAGGLLHQGDDDEEDDNQDDEEAKDDAPDTNDATTNNLWLGTLMDAGSTLLGATVIALSIAPTDEVPMISSAISPAWLLLLVAFSLLISYAIVFEADFVSQEARRNQQGVLQKPLGETVFSYLLSLGAAALMLWFFQVVHTSDPLGTWVSYSIVLGLPATLGGAAGRLAI